MFDPLSLNDFPEMTAGARCDVRVVTGGMAGMAVAVAST